MALGRIVAVDVRSIWPSEATNFTPWLAEAQNLTELANALHLGELTMQSTELSVGDFSADIVAVDEGGSPVLIENQLEQTDHRHLGQVLTYLAGIGSAEATVIWISTRLREEHRAAIDWLNRNTIEGYDFFGVEIEVLRIGDSDPAPRFNVVAMPNDWARQARQAVREVASETRSEVKALYQEYWRALKEIYEAIGGGSRFPKAWPRQWLAFRIGRSGFHIAAVVSRNEQTIRVELYMRQKGLPPKQAFRALIEKRDEIHAAYGAELDWQELPEKVASRIAVHLKDADINSRADWTRQHHWIAEEVEKFRRVFTNRVRGLQLNDSEQDDDDLDDAEGTATD